MNTLASNPITDSDTAIDTTAVMSGSAIPSSEPNTRNSTTAAAINPTTSAMPCPGWPAAAAPVISISTLLLLSW